MTDLLALCTRLLCAHTGKKSYFIYLKICLKSISPQDIAHILTDLIKSWNWRKKNHVKICIFQCTEHKLRKKGCFYEICLRPGWVLNSPQDITGDPKNGTHLQLESNVTRSKSYIFESQKKRSVSAVLLVFEAFKNIHFWPSYRINPLFWGVTQ